LSSVSIGAARSGKRRSAASITRDRGAKGQRGAVMIPVQVLLVAAIGNEADGKYKS